MGVRVSPTPRPHLPPGKTRYPLYRRLGRPQCRSGQPENLVPTGIRTPDRPARSQSLYRLSYLVTSRGIALLFLDHGTKEWVSGQQHALAALYPRERLGTHCTGGWVGPSAGLDDRKISSPPGFDPRPSSP